MAMWPISGWCKLVIKKVNITKISVTINITVFHFLDVTLQ